MHKAILRLQPRETFLVRKSQTESCRFCAFAKACAWRIPGGKLFFPCVGRLLKRGLFASDSKQRILVILVTCSKLFASHFAPLPSIRSFNNFEGCALRAAAGGRAVRSIRVRCSQPSVLGQISGATWNGLSGPRHRRHVSVGLAAKCRFGCLKSRQLCAIACHSG